MRRIRVLVVEDSLTVRRRICGALAADPEIELAGEAADGREAIELCRERRPDVVTMDMILPVMSGLAATEHIMAYCPTPILVVSSSFNRGELFKTYDALAAGAVDVFEKPTGVEAEGVWERNLLARLKLVSKIRVITHPRPTRAGFGRPPNPAAVPTAVRLPGRAAAVLAIGASTGGPAAIVEVLGGLPVAFRRPILLVLHISEPFGVAFADWLNSRTARRVVYAQDGETVASIGSGVAIAPPGRHLVIRERRLRLTDDPERHSCRPSVDVLFESVARDYGPAAAGVLLTGMGKDGAAGLLEIHRAGGLTIAQDETSSVVYGMPRQAALLGAAQRVLPLKDIGPTLGALVTEKFEERG
jgi:two-component system chemotaxis response regulator CheB